MHITSSVYGILSQSSSTEYLTGWYGESQVPGMLGVSNQKMLHTTRTAIVEVCDLLLHISRVYHSLSLFDGPLLCVVQAALIWSLTSSPFLILLVSHEAGILRGR